MGAVVLESRTTVSGIPPGRDDCLLVVPRYDDGVHRSQLRGFDPGSSMATDFRFRYQGRTRFSWVMSAGGGWMWAQEIPFVLAGVGIRTPGRVKAVVDLEWNRFRIPFDVVTQEWSRGSVVRELIREREHEWQSGWSLRFGAEYAL